MKNDILKIGGIDTVACLKNCKNWSEMLDRCVRCDKCESEDCAVCDNRCEEAVFLGELVCPEFQIEGSDEWGYLEGEKDGVGAA
jgi:hypothetical protein